MPEIFPIGGGKGGVGKSFITANLGALIAGRGKRVVLIDMDLGGSNLHTFLGVKSPNNGMDRFLNKTARSLDSTVVPTPIPNLFLISSFNCSMEIANLYHTQKKKLINAIRNLSFDYILLDLGAGTNFNTLDFFLTSRRGIFICTPEPTSIENAFRFIKAVYLRIFKRIVKLQAFNASIENAANNPGQASAKSQDLIEAVLKHSPEKESFLRNSLNKFQFKFIINQFRRNSNTTLGEKMQTVCNQHFYSDFQFLGNIAYDERVAGSISSKKLFIKTNPVTTTTTDLKQIAHMLIHNDSSSANLSNLS